MTRDERDPERDDELSRLLQRWSAPLVPDGIDERMLAAYRRQTGAGEPWWSRLFTASVRVPLPVAVGVLMLLIVTAALALRPVAPQPTAGTTAPSAPVQAARHGDVPVETYYWFVTESANYDRQGYPLAGPQLTAFQRALSVIVGGIEQGLFPARPGQSRNDGFENCQLCPYDRVCPGNRARVWGRKRSAPELREYLDLAEPED